jgi:ribosomal protein L25 (general stress protein Ctc)
VQTAYQAGHWRDFEENAKHRPYLMYDAINDSRVRPAHLALDGVIRPVGDAYWRTHSPQLGHRCRCTLRSLSRPEAMRRGGATQNPPAEGGADAGWGSDPRQWSETLKRLIRDRQSACKVDAANFGRKQRPVSQNVDCTEWGAKMLDMAKNPQPALIVDFAKKAVSVADRQMVEDIGPVENHAMLLAKTGVDLSGYTRSIDNYAVRHTIKQHGNPEKEAARGQLAVTLEDFGLIPEITSTPDHVFHGGQNRVKRDVTIYTKLIDGIGYWYVEEIRTGRKQAAADAMRKKKGAWSAP